jgi:hypothetical protein
MNHLMKERCDKDSYLLKFLQKECDLQEPKVVVTPEAPTKMVWLMGEWPSGVIDEQMTCPPLLDHDSWILTIKFSWETIAMAIVTLGYCIKGEYAVSSRKIPRCSTNSNKQYRMSNMSIISLEITPTTLHRQCFPCWRTSNVVAIVTMGYGHTCCQIGKISFELIYKWIIFTMLILIIKWIIFTI